jgi:hypothetical protein
MPGIYFSTNPPPADKSANYDDVSFTKTAELILPKNKIT